MKVYACVALNGAPVPVEESVPLILKLKVPPAVGVPESTPVAALKVTPAGSAPPVRLKVYGAVPPLAEIVCDVAMPTVAATSIAGLTATVGAFTTSVTAEVPLYGPEPVVASVPFTVMLKLPAAVGVPERTPALESVMPAGNVLTVV